MNDIKNGAAYIRVSTDRQEELSPDAQKRLILDFAKKNNIIISGDMIFEDLGISGKRASKREQFRNMIATAKSDKHPIDVILVWKFSRFARNQEESIVYKNLLRKAKVEVISISEPVIDGAFGSLIERIIEWMDEYYSTNLSTEVFRGMTEKAMRGGYQANAPIGYTMKKGGVPQVDPDTSFVVQRIFSEYVNGHDLNCIARSLNDDGITTKRGGLWESRTIRYILENPFYIGKVRWNRAKHSSYIPNDAEDIIITDGKHEPIITNDTFTAAKEMLAKKHVPYGTKKRSVSGSKHWLSGVMRCSECGASLSFTSSHDCSGKRVYPHFQCYRYNKGVHRGSQYISEQKVVDAVLSSLNEVISTGTIEFKYNVLSDNTASLVTYSNQLRTVSKKKERVKLAYMNGIDTLEEYKANKKLIEEEEANIRKKISECKVASKKVTKAQMIDRVRNVYQVVTDDNVLYDVKSTAIRSIIDSIIYTRETDTFTIMYIYS